MLGGADNPNGELPSYITGADTCSLYTQSLAMKCTSDMTVRSGSTADSVKNYL